MEISKCPFCSSQEVYEIFIDRFWRCKSCLSNIRLDNQSVNAISTHPVSPQTNFIAEADTKYDSM